MRRLRPCRWQEGRCTFGERCNYAHGEAELRPLPPEGYEILERMEHRRMRQDVSTVAAIPIWCIHLHRECPQLHFSYYLVYQAAVDSPPWCACYTCVKREEGSYWLIS